MQRAYSPEEAILQQRVQLSKAFSAFRRVRPRVPFWYLPAHRVPTLWTLYRGLLRHASGKNIKWRIRMFFEQYRSLTSPQSTRDKLAQGHKFLDAFRRAEDGDERLLKVLSRYDAMIRAKRAKEEMKSMILEQLAWQKRLRNRPIMTGGFLRPSILNKPLPRLKPQPEHISMMMVKRRRAYERMGDEFAQLKEFQADIATEIQFEKLLMLELQSDPYERRKLKRVFYGVTGWYDAIETQKKAIRKILQRACNRALAPYPPEMVAAIKEARREKIRNKTRERERERRGEVLRSSLRRTRKGPPPHVLERMSEWRRHADKVIRNPTEVGYVGMMKSRLGIKMKNPNLWRELEEGIGEESSREREMTEKTDEVNARTIGEGSEKDGEHRHED